jgi:hypothetical protein
LLEYRSENFSSESQILSIAQGFSGYGEIWIDLKKAEEEIIPDLIFTECRLKCLSPISLNRIHIRS